VQKTCLPKCWKKESTGRGNLKDRRDDGQMISKIGQVEQWRIFYDWRETDNKTLVQEVNYFNPSSECGNEKKKNNK